MKFTNPLNRLRGVRSVESALMTLIDPYIVREVARDCSYPGEVLERVAAVENFGARVLLMEVSKVLGVPSRSKLHLPSIELIAALDLEYQQLRDALVLPQENPQKFSEPIVAVADPASAAQLGLSRDTMELCLASDIRGMWQDIDSLADVSDGDTALDQQAIIVLRRLADDTESIGGTEVFVDAVKAEYEVLANEQVYRGVIGRPMIRSFECLLNGSDRVTLSLRREHPSRHVEISRTSGGANSGYVVRMV